MIAPVRTDTPRRRGRPARISRDQIVAAALRLDPGMLTMQAVADELGVDRKALHHHVSDRDGLLQLVATSAFQTRMIAAHNEGAETWQQATANFARATRDGVIATGVLSGYVRFEGDGDLRALAPAEAMLKLLLAAGFREADAGRFLEFVAEFVYTSARNSLARAARGEHPQRSELIRALSEAGERYSAMKHLMETGLDPFDNAQFDFGLRVAIRGMTTLLKAETS